MVKIIDQFQGTAISITSHSLVFDPQLLKQKNVIKYKILKSLFPKALKRQAISNYFYQNLLIKYINSLYGKKSISLIVHQNNIKKMLNFYTKIPVYDHPIVSPTSEDITKYNTPQAREDIINKYNLDKDKTYFAVFGFYGPYKGIDLAIKALKYLPENYNLIIGSNIHPTANFKQRNINIKSEGKNIIVDTQQNKYLQYINNIITQVAKPGDKDDQKNKTKIFDRIHYINHIFLEDDFKQLIAGVDIAVLPYYEVGQGGSGPASYATFLTHSGKIILSRTGCFESYSQAYFPECFTFFDQGNEIELAKKILTVQSKRENLLKEAKNFGPQTNAMTYVKSLIF
jgi:glycosyltransferase involved in cell wall biosynthesis